VIEATRRKLREARFFHQHLMNLRHGKSATYEPEAFGYYFSAFMSAARSVLWVLHHEEKTKWEAWEPTWKATLNDEERKFLRFTNQLRTAEVKRSGAETIVEWEDVGIDELLSINIDVERQHPAYGMHSQPGFSASAKVMRRAYYLEQENGKEEVTAVGQRYLNFLEKVVQEFEQAHQSQ
jgi:hypothetical protein